MDYFERKHEYFSLFDGKEQDSPTEICRIVFISWLLFFSQDEVIWSDEKYFVLKQGPNKSINKVWAPVNPYINDECKTQSQQKIMVWVGLFAGEVIGPFWIESKMNNQVYKVWPAIRTKVTKHRLWSQHDWFSSRKIQRKIDLQQDRGDIVLIWDPWVFSFGDM